jgi:hypothetical protein
LLKAHPISSPLNVIIITVIIIIIIIKLVCRKSSISIVARLRTEIPRDQGLIMARDKTIPSSTKSRSVLEPKYLSINGYQGLLVWV